jgi:thioredoxin reductase
VSVELPARIAILGAGPIGLETALYARYLGYDVDVYERGRVAEHLLRWGHARLFTPFGATASTLGKAALAAQDAGWRSPAKDALLTAGELVEQYYQPLARSDLLVDHIHLGAEALAISRGALFKGELAGEERATSDFRLLIAGATSAGSNAAPEEKIAPADVVVDATGNYAQHNWLGAGGIPAIGELGAQDHIEYGLPDILGRDRADYAHRHTLLVGSGHAAAACAVALAQLGHEAPYTRFTWIVRRDLEGKFDPIRHIENDPWPARNRLATMANQLIQGELGHLAFHPATSVEEVVWQGGLEQFHVRLGGKHAEELAVDRIIAGVGHRGDSSLYAELQVSDDPRRGAPQGCSQASDSQASFEEALSPEAARLMTGEPDFYVLGAKSFGRDSRFTIPDGLEQIRLLFTILGGRADLNLYRTPK